MTTVSQFLAANQDERPTVERDHLGRYVLPDPNTGERRSWTRATTMAKTCGDTFGLERWMRRNVALGIAQRADLAVALLAANAVGDIPATDNLVEMAMEQAGGNIGSRHGTAIHALSERVDKGEHLILPPHIQADLDAYRAAMAPFTVVESERIVIQPDLGVAGTLDRIVAWRDELFILDIKTGNVDRNWMEIATQLHLYATAPLMWDPATKGYQPMPAVSRDRALVLHLPKGGAQAELWQVDISRADEIVYLATEVRRVRKLRDLAQPFDPAAPDQARLPEPEPEPQRPEPAPEPEPEPAAVVELRPGQRWPFNPPDDDGTQASPDDVTALVTLMKDAPERNRARLKRWAQEAVKAGRAFDTPPLTQRMWHCARAAFALALHCADTQCYDALSRVLDGDVPPTWSIGATVGSLNIAQADEVARLALSDELAPF